MAELYNHDADSFTDALENRGFIVMDQVVTPYSQTLPTMASVMSGDTVDLRITSENPNRVRRDLGYTISNGPVIDVLRDAGYVIASTRSGYHFLDFDDAVEIAKPASWMTSFEANLLPVGLGLHGKIHNDRLRAIMAPGTLDGLQQPFFYYQHILAPHPPFSINADGTNRRSHSISYADAKGIVGGNGEHRPEYIEGYRQKAAFVENALIAQIDALPEGRKIVVIHGDHGPGAYLDHQNAANTCLAERMQTFAAIYSNVPEVTAALKEQQHRPFFLVNLYRLILGRLSQTEIALLPELSRHLKWSNLSAQTVLSSADFARSCTATQVVAAN